MLGTDSRANAEFAYHSQNLYGCIWATRPVTQVFRKSFFTAVNDGSDGYVRHWLKFLLYSRTQDERKNSVESLKLQRSEKSQT